MEGYEKQLSDLFRRIELLGFNAAAIVFFRVDPVTGACSSESYIAHSPNLPLEDDKQLITEAIRALESNEQAS